MPKPLPNSTYDEKKAAYRGMITLYGRKTVLEVINDAALDVHRLHIARTNRQSPVIDEIMAGANARGIEIREHDRPSLSRISRNQRQDQGVAVDLLAPGFNALATLAPDPARDLLIVDQVTNPQNLGMILRSVAGSPLQGVILPAEGTARLDPLVYKASAGCLLRASIYYCETTREAFDYLGERGVRRVGLAADAPLPIAGLNPGGNAFVVGNESTGIDATLLAECDERVSIPLANGVESLNVGVTAALIAFRTVL